MAFSIDEVTAALQLLGGGPFENLQLIDASALGGQRYPHLDPNTAVLVLGRKPGDGAQLGAALLPVYGPAHEIVFLGAPQGGLMLNDLCAEAPAGPFYVPPLARPASYAALQDVVARLRAPDGCPWDRALTWEQLRPSLLEEAYELLTALDQGDFAKVREEQGDVLLQIALQAQIAAEEDRFRFPDVIAQIVEKLIRRHPHVFGEVAVSGTDEVLANWEAIKAAERAESGEKASPLAGVPPGLPALAQAEAYLDRLSRLRTLPPATAPWTPLARAGDDEPLSPEVLGEALFGIVAWARARGVQAESALRAANARFATENTKA